MAEYKNIWYTDGSQPLSIADYTYKQAVSIGDALENVRLNTAIKCMSEAEVTALYPTPKQFNRVYRADIGKEFMYFEPYNQYTNPLGRKYPGWYVISNGMLSIRDSAASSDGTSTTISDSGKVSFVGAKNVYLP